MLEPLLNVFMLVWTYTQPMNHEPQLRNLILTMEFSWIWVFYYTNIRTVPNYRKALYVKEPYDLLDKTACLIINKQTILYVVCVCVCVCKVYIHFILFGLCHISVLIKQKFNYLIFWISWIKIKELNNQERL